MGCLTYWEVSPTKSNYYKQIVSMHLPCYPMYIKKRKEKENLNYNHKIRNQKSLISNIVSRNQVIYE